MIFTKTEIQSMRIYFIISYLSKDKSKINIHLRSLLKLIKRKTNANEANQINLANCNCTIDSMSNKKNKTDNVVNLIQNVKQYLNR